MIHKIVINSNVLGNADIEYLDDDIPQFNLTDEQKNLYRCGRNVVGRLIQESH